MRTPEEVAREAWCEVTWNAAEDWTCLTHETAWQREDEWCPAAVDAIRARDAEVREDALAGFEWVYETSFEDTGPCMAHEHTEHDGTEYVTSECYFPFAKQTRHLRGPREPVPTDTDTRESTP